MSICWDSFRGGVSYQDDARRDPLLDLTLEQDGRTDPLLNGHLFSSSKLNEDKRFMKLEEDKKILEVIRGQTRSGKPLGDGDFIETLSKRIGCNLSFRVRGRPRKK